MAAGANVSLKESLCTCDQLEFCVSRHDVDVQQLSSLWLKVKILTCFVGFHDDKVRYSESRPTEDESEDQSVESGIVINQTLDVGLVPPLFHPV